MKELKNFTSYKGVPYDAIAFAVVKYEEDDFGPHNVYEREQAKILGKWLTMELT